MSTTTPASVPTTGTWKIDSVHSTVTFGVRHMVVATFRGHFHDVTGQLVDGVLTGEVKSDTLDVGTLPVFKEHLSAADWFDIANFPTLSFTSTDLHDHDGSLHASGELTIKGITKPVSITGSVRGPIEVPGQDGTPEQRLGLDLSTTINRREFNITGGGGAEDQVAIDVALELVAA